MEFICKIAERDEINKRWDDLIKMHPDDDSWKGYKEKTLRYFDEEAIIQYYGILDGKIICECCAHINNNANNIKNAEGLLDDRRAYLNAFRCDKEYEGKGYFSKLYYYMENDLKNRGYTEVSLGVEPCEIRNIQIYFHLGFTNYIKTDIDEYLPVHEGDEPEKVYVNYYFKRLRRRSEKQNKILTKKN